MTDDTRLVLTGVLLLALLHRTRKVFRLYRQERWYRKRYE